MQEVGKAVFRATYFRYRRDADGWTEAYWQHFYEPEREPPMRYLVQLPQHAVQTRMMIVDDYAAREHRLFFISEQAEERLFSPGGEGETIGG